MKDNLFIVILTLVASGFFSVGLLWASRKTEFWKIEWIKVEHDLARFQCREPREVADMEDGDNE